MVAHVPVPPTVWLLSLIHNAIPTVSPVSGFNSRIAPARSPNYRLKVVKVGPGPIQGNAHRANGVASGGFRHARYFAIVVDVTPIGVICLPVWGVESSRRPDN